MKKGKTGAIKDAILVHLLIAEQRHGHISVSDLAVLLHVRKNTISGHLRDMSDCSRAAERYSALVRETHLRGQWELTPAGRLRAQAHRSPHQGIEFRGYIAAGPAIPLSDENLDEYLIMNDLDPDTHFALRVKGSSMLGHHICDGDIVVLRRVTIWDYVPDGAIVAALVPEGTDTDLPDWLERIKLSMVRSAGAHLPALDHVTLKEMDEPLRRLRGSQGTVEPPVLQVIGVLVRIQRDYRDGKRPTV